MTDSVKYLLDESRIPKAWYNLQADLPKPLPAVLHPGTGQPIGPEDLLPLFPMELIRQEVTTEGGLDVAANLQAVSDTRRRMNERGIEVSLFISPDHSQIEAAANSGAQFIELHTGAFADAFAEGREPDWKRELDRLAAGAERAHILGLKVNAGHGLNYVNLPLLYCVPHLVELNIGHTIVSRGVSVGMKTAVSDMLALMKNYPQNTLAK